MSSMPSKQALYIACPAKQLKQQEHIRDCGAGPGEPCNNRGSMAELHGLHFDRDAAWMALSRKKRRAILVAVKLRRAARNDDG